MTVGFTDLNTGYEIVRFWLPLVSGFAIVVKAYMSAKKSVGEWASKLLDNHLSHIQASTEQTTVETKQTNKLLVEQAKHFESMLEHNKRETQVWQGVVNTLAVLKDRGRDRSRARSRRKK